MESPRFPEVDDEGLVGGGGGGIGALLTARSVLPDSHPLRASYNGGHCFSGIGACRLGCVFQFSSSVGAGLLGGGPCGSFGIVVIGLKIGGGGGGGRFAKMA